MKVLLEENKYAEVTSEGTLIISNVTEGPLGQDRIRCIGFTPTGTQALLDFLVNGEAVEQPRAPDVANCHELHHEWMKLYNFCPECGADVRNAGNA